MQCICCIINAMVKLTITENEQNQRLDRFLKKYLKSAPLSHIYKLIRKDIKVNGKRVKADLVLRQGDEVILYMDEAALQNQIRPRKKGMAKRQFGIAYEDENLLIVNKPFGLLTHGDSKEKKNTLANQVCGYLQEKGEYQAGGERIFVPSPVNRLDRNTTGLVMFGKNSRTLQVLSSMMREKGRVSKSYLTITAGELDEVLTLTHRMEKDSRSNRVSVLPLDSGKGKIMETVVRPLEKSRGFTLMEVELLTGRTHQIRAHLGQAGFPVIGDAKYGNKRVNQVVKQRFGLTTQLLHAYKLRFNEADSHLSYLTGQEITAALPQGFVRIKKQIFD